MASAGRVAPAALVLAAVVALGAAVLLAGSDDDPSGGPTSADPDRATTAPTTSTSTVPPTTRRPRTFTLAMAGDLLTHLPVNASAAAHGDAVGAAYDFGALLAPMRPVLAEADLALCHLEVPVAPDGEAPSGYPVFGAPGELVAGIAASGYDGCSTASNHSLDQGAAGVTATLDALDRAGIGHAGTARDPQEAARPALYEVAGTTVAHLSYAYGFNGIPLPAEAPWAANRIDPGRIAAEADAARKAGADFVVVSLHWGDEYRHEPNAEQRRLAPVLIGSPAVDLIVGHHAHVVQPIERFGDEYVVYGTGNQLSNQSEPERRDGLTVVLTVAEAPDGRFLVTDLRCEPTWVDLDGHRVIPARPALVDPAGGPGLRAELSASFERTVATAGACG